VGCGGLRFTFRSGLPGHARYCVDYYPRPGAGWFELLADDGWTVLPAGSGWQLCRKPFSPGEARPELFTDGGSVIRRNNRLLGTMVALFACGFATGLSGLLPNPFLLGELAIGDDWRLVAALSVAGAGIIGFYGFAVGKLLAANRLLRRKRQLRDR
jgi:hypothetical protein